MILASSLEGAAKLLVSWNLLCGLCRLAQAANLFKVLPTPSQGGKPENLCRNSFISKNSSLGSASLELIVTPRHISKADVLKECSLGLSQLTL